MIISRQHSFWLVCLALFSMFGCGGKGDGRPDNQPKVIELLKAKDEVELETVLPDLRETDFLNGSRFYAEIFRSLRTGHAIGVKIHLTIAFPSPVKINETRGDRSEKQTVITNFLASSPEFVGELWLREFGEVVI